MKHHKQTMKNHAKTMTNHEIATVAVEKAARCRNGWWSVPGSCRGVLEMVGRACLGAAGALKIAAQAARPRWSALIRRSSPLRSEILLGPAVKPPTRTKELGH